MRIRGRKKLSSEGKVEVRSIEDGFVGSWHPGIVISSRRGSRDVEYDHLLDNDSKGKDDNLKLFDTVPVSDVIDGLGCKVFDDCYRGRIRPEPPLIEFNLWCYGQCVDVYYKDAWWEGVVFDSCDGEDVRSVFFPDMGDESLYHVGDMRVSMDWDEWTGEWKLRGRWLFLELIDELKKDKWPIVVSVKQLWYDVRVKRRFVEDVKEWISLRRDLWRELLLEVVVENLKFALMEFFGKSKFLGRKELEEYNRVMELSPSDLYALMKSEFCDEIRGNEVVPVATKSDTLPLSSLVTVRLEDEAPEMEALVCRVDDDEMLKEDCNISHKKLKSSKDRVWIPCGPEIVPEYCVDADEEYFKVRNNLSKARNKHEVALKFRGHLLSLGWKIEYRQDELFRRWRYAEPGGNVKWFKSLFEVSKYLKQKSLSAKASRFPLSDVADPTNSSPLVNVDQSQGCSTEVIKDSNSGDDVMIEPEYFPQAVISYYAHERKKEKVHPKDHDKLDMGMKAKKHLLAVGWKIFVYSNNTQSLRYKSPCGKLYVSLLSACRGYLDEQRNVMKLVETRFAGNLAIAAEGVHGTHDNETEKHLASRTRTRSRSRSSGRVLGSGIRAREGVVPSSDHTNPQTVLSWLIENKVVSFRQKVQYRWNDEVMAVGRVTRYGIKCRCCQNIFTMRNFEIHAIGTRHQPSRQPSANIFLKEDGRSLLDCQMQLRQDIKGRSFAKEVNGEQQQQQHQDENDYICSVCHDGGELYMCDRCPSSFHRECVGLEEIPPDVDWFCPSCCCKICGEVLTDESVINCHQCEIRYHIGCLGMKDLVSDSYPNRYWFCSKNCEQISFAIQKLLGKQVQVGNDDLTWTLLKYVKPDKCDHDSSSIADSPEDYSKLKVALAVMHEVFLPMEDSHTGRDLIEDIIFNRWSKLNRLNFQGFYTVLLEKNGELITVAFVRIFGKNVAEIPLVGTRFQYRRQGMCRILMNEFEKVLQRLGVVKLVLPAVEGMLNTWKNSFGFSEMPACDKLKLLDYTFLHFQDTIKCQKMLLKEASLKGNENHEVSSCVTQLPKADQAVGDRCLITDEGSGSSSDEDENHGDGDQVRCYKRRKISKSAQEDN